MDENTIRRIVTDYIVNEFLFGEGENLTDETQLALEGVMDSIQTLRLVTFLEKTFSISLDAHEATNHTETIASIVKMVASKTA